MHFLTRKRAQLRSSILALILPLIFGAVFSLQSIAQTGSPSEPVRYIGGVTIDPNVHEGRLRYALGTESRQTIRVNHTHPEWAEGSGWTYNHASSLCYWNGKFYQQYLSNPVDEHIEPGQTLVCTSTDGRNWDKPKVVFPPYKAPEGVEIPYGYRGYMMHQRMGFYIAPNGRLLVLAFYGHAEDPFEEGGIGRVVCEAYKDGSFGPIYFIRYSSHTNWNESNTSYPFYTRSDDAGFVQACDDLLKDRLKTLQWWDEDKGLDGFYGEHKGGKGYEGSSALSYYTRKDGKVTALWKRSKCAISEDGINFSEPVKSPTLIMAGGKMWGQKTDDDRYAICYNPIENDEYRYPLIVISGDDGIIYDNMLLVQGEVPPRRFFGRWKDFGPCYVRGIVEGNGNPPGNDMWLTYSMNKEDMWVSRVPLPIRYAVEGPVNDNFDQMESGGVIDDWNIYSPKWCPLYVSEVTGGSGKSMVLEDRDPYDYARAIRIFEEGGNKKITCRVMAGQQDHGELELDIVDRYGNRPVRLKFDSDGRIKAYDGSEQKVITDYQKGEWYTISMDVEAKPYGSYSLSVNGNVLLSNAQLSEAVKSVERLSVRTGAYRNIPNRKTPNETPGPPLPGADEPVKKAVFYVDDVEIE